MILSLQKDHGFIFSTDRDFHIGDFGNINIKEDSVLDKTFSVPSEIAGIFSENKNNVSLRLDFNCYL